MIAGRSGGAKELGRTSEPVAARIQTSPPDCLGAHMSSRRGCLLIAAIVAVLLVAGGIVAYRGLDPDALRALAERHASAMLGAPVTIGRMRVSLFPIPAVTGTDVRLQSAGAGRAAAITVRGIRILPQWRTLISRPLVVDAVEIEGLTLLVRRDAEGRWLLPGGSPGGRSAPDSTSGGVPGLPGGSASDAVAGGAARPRGGRPGGGGRGM